MSQNEAAALWSKACRELQQILRHDVYSRWIEVIDAIELSDHTLTLAVDNDFYQTWLEENYLSLIQKALATVSAAEIKVVFSVRRAPAQPPPAEPEKKKKSLFERLTRPQRVPPTLNPKFTFDTFIVGPSNSFAHAAALAVAQAPARAYNPLFIYGGTGLGKTHVMQAIGHQVLSATKANVCYTSSEAILNEYID